MGFKVYNDLGRQKQDFVPIKQGEVSFYVCGPTVYDYFHIGNARPFIVFDVMRRYLEACGYKVTYAQNFTDVDDKIIKRAAQLGITEEELSKRYIDAYFEDADALGVKRASIHPQATLEMDYIIDIIARLIAKGHAYETQGDVYFDVQSYPPYGKLSAQSTDELLCGARVEVDIRKKHPLDFALWKAQKPGEPAWQSPWGMGRPGWHIECSAMCLHHLGETIDFHGGGCDLMFPHHENEVAQSEGANGVPFVNYWVHNGYLMIDKEKMSKSLGNFMTAREAMKKFPPIAIRLFMLSAHYRSPISFSEESLKQAVSSQERLKNGTAELLFALENRPDGQVNDENLRTSIEAARKKFYEAMDDDLNTAAALGCIFDAIKAVNTHLSQGTKGADKAALLEAKAFLEAADEILGVIGIKSASEKKAESNTEQAAKIEALLHQRDEARRQKNFALSDEIRKTLSDMGIAIEDTQHGTRIKVE